jgi:CYTH domain-containing protein
MSLEIERKYLVNRLPFSLESLTGTTINQGYVIVSADGIELRVRQRQARFFQTIKIGEGVSRTEIEIELAQDQFDRMWPHTKGRRVSKTRYSMPLGNHMAEVDRFEGELAGLLLVEVEFASLDDSRRFAPPDWFGLEVTEDKRYQNKHLAVYGIPGNQKP